ELSQDSFSSQSSAPPSNQPMASSKSSTDDVTMQGRPSSLPVSSCPMWVCPPSSPAEASAPCVSRLCCMVNGQEGAVAEFGLECRAAPIGVNAPCPLVAEGGIDLRYSSEGRRVRFTPLQIECWCWAEDLSGSIDDLPTGSQMPPRPPSVQSDGILHPSINQSAMGQDRGFMQRNPHMPPYGSPQPGSALSPRQSSGGQMHAGMPYQQNNSMGNYGPQGGQYGPQGEGQCTVPFTLYTGVWAFLLGVSLGHGSKVCESKCARFR
ncbi:hypothetical protein JZ751_015465, partial [Albula glossodonta]